MGITDGTTGTFPVNLKNKNNLNDHLLPGLVPLGVPKKLANTAFPFKYGDIKQLKERKKKRNWHY